MFEQATRFKVRFPWKGSISTEDLWDLSVTQLDKVYKTLSKDAKEHEDSLLDVKSTKDKVLDLQISIVKHIVTTKLAEAEAAKDSKVKKARKEKIRDIIAQKEDQGLLNMTVEELRKLEAE